MRRIREQSIDYVTLNELNTAFVEYLIGNVDSAIQNLSNLKNLFLEKCVNPQTKQEMIVDKETYNMIYQGLYENIRQALLL